MDLPPNSVVVVADGEKLLFFRNEGDGAFPNLVVEDKDVQASAAHHEQATDTAGRASNMVGGRGGSMEEVDFHQQDEDRFAAVAADRLRQRALADEFESLIVVAPPKTLGEMRKHYHKEVERRIVAEVPKDLTGHPVRQIEQILQTL